jgi:hypothetical protein
MSADDRDDLTIDEEFRRLADVNRERHRFSSRLRDRYDDPSYRAIIALGQSVVPTLLREMRDRPNWWGHALREITGANPEPEPSRPAPGWVGLSLPDIARSWVAWGRANGYDV